MAGSFHKSITAVVTPHREATENRVTCLIPTHDRPHFLRRMLDFYSQCHPRFRLCVIDSSNAANAEENRRAANRARARIDIDYKHVDAGFVEKVSNVLRALNTPYIVFCADDDVLFPEAVLKAVQFLEREPTYSSAMGRTVFLDTRNRRNRCVVLKGYSIDDESPFVRCQRLAARWFPSFYAVYRTSELLDSFSVTAFGTTPGTSAHMQEMMLSQLGVLRGKFKLLPVMYSLRQHHENNAGSRKHIIDLDAAGKSYICFRSTLTEQFKKFGIDSPKASAFIEEYFGFYRDPTRRFHQGTRSLGWKATDLVISFVERVADRFRDDSVRHRRAIRKSDFAEDVDVWKVALRMMHDFPQGMPSDQSTSERCA